MRRMHRTNSQYPVEHVRLNTGFTGFTPITDAYFVERISSVMNDRNTTRDYAHFTANPCVQTA